MWRIIVIDKNGAIIEKTPLSGPGQTTMAWESAYENPEYTGKTLTLNMLENSTIKLSHRFDLEPEIFGWLEKDAARKFFE